jgi:hypothetical protein
VLFVVSVFERDGSRAFMFHILIVELAGQCPEVTFMDLYQTGSSVYLCIIMIDRY